MSVAGPPQHGGETGSQGDGPSLSYTDRGVIRLDRAAGSGTGCAHAQCEVVGLLSISIFILSVLFSFLGRIHLYFGSFSTAFLLFAPPGGVGAVSQN